MAHYGTILIELSYISSLHLILSNLFQGNYYGLNISMIIKINIFYRKVPDPLLQNMFLSGVV